MKTISVEITYNFTCISYMKIYFIMLNCNQSYSSSQHLHIYFIQVTPLICDSVSSGHITIIMIDLIVLQVVQHYKVEVTAGVPSQSELTLGNSLLEHI